MSEPETTVVGWLALLLVVTSSPAVGMAPAKVVVPAVVVNTSGRKFKVVSVGMAGTLQVTVVGPTTSRPTQPKRPPPDVMDVPAATLNVMVVAGASSAKLALLIARS